MTPRKRRQWARVFIGARRRGLGTPELLGFAVACARQVGSPVPVLLAGRVVARAGRARVPRPAWRSPPEWLPRVGALLAVGLALGVLFSPSRSAVYRAPASEGPLPEVATTDWLTRDGGTIAVPMPPKRLERQQAPPCLAPPGGQVEFNGGCWIEVMGKPPCGQFYEHAGKCYVPMRETPRPPTSVDPAR
ncbi:hypothetical protein [Melittangium boletus]|uniref:hypothetical protein n=1 Tax=Melittangium boletus TaxID=83453 RepID=UPI003DA2CC17